MMNVYFESKKEEIREYEEKLKKEPANEDITGWLIMNCSYLAKHLIGSFDAGVKVDVDTEIFQEALKYAKKAYGYAEQQYENRNAKDVLSIIRFRYLCSDFWNCCEQMGNFMEIAGDKSTAIHYFENRVAAVEEYVNTVHNLPVTDYEIPEFMGSDSSLLETEYRNMVNAYLRAEDVEAAKRMAKKWVDKGRVMSEKSLMYSGALKMYEILVNNDGDEKEVEEYLKIVKEYIGGQ